MLGETGEFESSCTETGEEKVLPAASNMQILPIELPGLNSAPKIQNHYI